MNHRLAIYIYIYLILFLFLNDLFLFFFIVGMQTGIISPSKLRMKLIGPHHNRKKDGSNSNSARTSPSRLDDSEFVRNSLLNGGFDDEGQ